MARMQRLRIASVAISVLVLGASAAQAQTEGRLGVVLAYPSSVGFQWQAADKLAIRFDADYSQFNYEATSGFGASLCLTGFPCEPEVHQVTTASRTHNIAVGVSLLFDLHRSDELRVYVAPRVGIAVGRTSVKTTFSADPADLAAVTVPADETFNSTGPAAGIAFGASHDLNGRFRVFGEAGFQYVRGTDTGAFRDDVKTSSLGLRGGAGVVILF
jgi:opacity protein-like surface antigen